MKSRLVKKAVPVNRRPLFPDKGPGRRLRACFLGVILLLPMIVQGTETDNFTDRYEPLPDVLDVLDVEVNRLLQLAVDEANARTGRDIGLAESDGCDESRLYRAIYRQLGGLLVGRFESLVNDAAAEWGRRPARKNSVYRDFQWFEAPSLGTQEQGRLAATINMGGFLVGTDKFGHFFSEGYSSFQRAFLDGGGVDAALEYGDSTERTYYGALVTGVYSYADLVANFNGMRFWTHVLGRYSDPLGGRQNPLVRCEQGHWRLVSTFGWSRYLDAGWDEGLNCNLLRNEVLRDKLLRIIARFEEGSGRSYSCPISLTNVAGLRAKYGRYFPELFNIAGLGVLGPPLAGDTLAGDRDN